MTVPLRFRTARQAQGQSRILDALAKGDAALTGTLDEIGSQLGLTPSTLRASLLLLAYEGRITIVAKRGSPMLVRLVHQTSA
jgi:DNA-binding IclR family transcriptional regulator